MTPIPLRPRGVAMATMVSSAVNMVKPRPGADHERASAWGESRRQHFQTTAIRGWADGAATRADVLTELILIPGP
jgi:hypothetical protein